MADLSLDGFLVVDKPRGPTSHDVVAAVRRATGIKKVGHAGTLDPMATGVVVVAIGRATRLIRFVQDLDKEYEATARFGESTDTLDADGTLLVSEPMEVDLSDVVEAAHRFVGPIMQVPPMVSALKVDGRRLYDLAREGKEVERAPRLVEIHELEILDVGPPPFPEVRMRVRCGKGTYIRSLAADMAAALGGHAHLTALRRTAVGHLDLGGAVAMDDLGERWASHLIMSATALRALPSVVVDDEVATAISHGMVFARSPAPDVVEGEHFSVCAPSGRLLAVYRSTGAGARPEVVVA
jgi:tRNA pseudouridine55 synthase